jgi:hypothetical protein
MRKRKICKQVTFSSAWGKEMSESISSCLFLSYFSQSVSSLAAWLIHTTQHWSYILFLEVLGLELRASHLLGRHSTAWPTPPALELTKLEKWYEGSRGSYVAASNMLEVELQYSARVQKWSTTNFCVVSVSVIWIIFFFYSCLFCPSIRLITITTIRKAVRGCFCSGHFVFKFKLSGLG